MTAYDADGITVHHGDCLDVMPTLAWNVDAILADLPYATTQNDWDRPIDPKMLWSCYRQLTGARSPVVLFGSGLFTARMMLSNEADYRYGLVWDKEAVTGHLNSKRQPLRSHEDLMVFYRQAPTYNPQLVHTGRASHPRGSRSDRTVNHWHGFDNTPVVDQDGWQYPRSILAFKRPKGRHPTQKPVALMEWLISTFTNPGDLILDNVAGSGTTLVAARNLGRRAIGIEARPDYVDMIVERLDSGATGDKWPSHPVLRSES
jgi:site-specific DNA-methyltransferase (adenine-specific)